MEVRPTKEGQFTNIVDEQDWWFGPVALGNMSQYKVMVVKTNRGVFIGVEGQGCYEFQNFCHPGYVKDKLNLKHHGDAENITDFINQQLGFNGETYGTYVAHLCKED